MYVSFWYWCCSVFKSVVLRYRHVYREVVLGAYCVVLLARLLCCVTVRSTVSYCCGICCIVLFRSIGPFDKFIVLFSPIHCLVLLLSLYSFCRHFVAQLLLSCVHLYELIELTHFWLTCFCKPFLQKCPQNVFGFMKVCVLKSEGV